MPTPLQVSQSMETTGRSPESARDWAKASRKALAAA
jgi:hypothetical protein